MVNVNLLKAEIVKNGFTQLDFCKKIGMSHSTFVRKMKTRNLTTNEAEKMIAVLGIEEPTKFFLQQINLTG